MKTKRQPQDNVEIKAPARFFRVSANNADKVTNLRLQTLLLSIQNHKPIRIANVDLDDILSYKLTTFRVMKSLFEHERRIRSITSRKIRKQNISAENFKSIQDSNAKELERLASKVDHLSDKIDEITRRSNRDKLVKISEKIRKLNNIINMSESYESKIENVKLTQLNEQRRELQRYSNEIGWHRPHYQFVPDYEFMNYETGREKIIDEGARFIGRALHIMARQALHHPEIEFSWERCIKLFENRDMSEPYLVEPSAPIFREREETSDNGNRWKGETISCGKFKDLKSRYEPIIHILAAIDVLYSRAYFPANPGGQWGRYEVLGGIGPTAGHTFMDHPNEDALLRATLSYALWFQEFGAGNLKEISKKKLINPQKMIQLKGDIAFPQIVHAPVLLGRRGKLLAVKTAIYGDLYFLDREFIASSMQGAEEPPLEDDLELIDPPEIWTLTPAQLEELGAKWGIHDDPLSELAPDNTQKRSTDAVEIKPSFMILPPLPTGIVNSFKEYIPRANKKGTPKKK